MIISKHWEVAERRGVMSRFDSNIETNKLVTFRMLFFVFYRLSTNLLFLFPSPQ